MNIHNKFQEKEAVEASAKGQKEETAGVGKYKPEEVSEQEKRSVDKGEKSRQASEAETGKKGIEPGPIDKQSAKNRE